PSAAPRSTAPRFASTPAPGSCPPPSRTSSWPRPRPSSAPCSAPWASTWLSSPDLDAGSSHGADTRGVSELMRLARGRDVDAVLGTFRGYGRDEVLAVADWLREEDIYQVAIELYRWVLDEAD